MNFNPAREGKESVAAPVALMGMACRFPGSSNTPDQFWHYLLSGQSAIGEIPADRFSIAAHVDANPEAPGRSYSRWGGFIDDVAGFDPSMFEISPREAVTMDPQQRLLLMVAYEAMEDAGLTRAQLGEVKTGVFVGVSASDYASILRQQHANSDVYSGTGSALSIVANRLSHRFNLKGPSLSIDTACSSSLVALDQAVMALNSGRIDIAIVAGAHLLIDPSPFVAFSKAGMLSPTGRLAAFDRRANGYVRGEGIGAVLLMREADALYQGRRTRALIRATASNQDGRTPTLTAPDAMAQRAMMRQLVHAAGVDPNDVDYVEAHGTGTPVGDPIEASAIGHVFGGARRRSPLLLGSVKPSIGHLEAAAGIASLVKAVLSLEHRRVPASVNFEEPNPAIPFGAHNMAVPVADTALGGSGAGPLLIAVNSFGFGGTNAGVLLESSNAKVANSSGQRDSRSVAVAVSAASADALRAVAGNLRDAVEHGVLAGRSPNDIAASLGVMREGLGYRAAVIAETETELLAGLAQLAEADAPPPVRGALPSIVSGNPRSKNRLAFTYAGQGGQWPGMARRLLHDEPVFAAAFREFDRTFERLSGWSVRPELLRESVDSRLGQSRFAMPAIFGVQLGLGALWRSWGVIPDFVIGHSFGELAAAHLAGAIDLDTATRMIHVRCQIRERIGRDGGMLAVGMSAPEIAALLGPDSAIDIAATNSEAMVTLAGPVEAIADFSARMERDAPSVLVRPIQSDTAWHSRQLAPLEDWFRGEIGAIQWQAPKLTFVSTVTGRVENRLDADYWWQNLRQSVRYRDAVAMALELGANVFLELSPHRVLSGLNAGNAASQSVPATIANSLVRNEDDFRALAVAAAQLSSAGVSIDWKVASGGKPEAAGLPTYPWQLSRFWRTSEEAQDQLHVAPNFPLLGKRQRGPDPIWINEISLGGYPYLRDHVVGGDVVFPATGYLEIMLSAGREVFGDVMLELEDFEISAALFIGAEEHILVSTRFDAARQRIELRTRTRDGAAEWIVRARAKLHPTDVAAELSLRAPGGDATPMGADDFHAETARAGFGYGPTFSGVVSASVDSESATGTVVAPELTVLGGSSTHPCLLDAAVQLAIPILAKILDASDDEAGRDRYVPKRLRRLRFAGPLSDRLDVDACVARDAGGTLLAHYRVADADGRCLLTIEGLELLPMGKQAATAETERVRPSYYAEAFVDFALVEPRLLSGEWLVLDAGGEGGSELADLLSGAGGLVDQLAMPSVMDAGADVLALAREHVLARISGAQAIVFHANVGTVSESDIVATSERLTLQLIAVAQAIQSHEGGVGPKELIVLTHGARQLPQDPPMDLDGLAASPLVGLARTIASEIPDLKVLHIDTPKGDLAELAAALSCSGAESELVYRGGSWLVPRLVVDKRSDLPRGLVEIDPASVTDTFRLTMKAPGSSGGLFLEACPVPALGPGEVLVETAAVGLNFRDVMAVTGLLPTGAEPDPAWLNLGLEFSGTIREVGPGVSGLEPGDRVMGMARACMRGIIAAPAAALSLLPAGLSFEDAATIPSAFATAHYALVRAGRLQKGERVLIHLGTGGVGLAAIQVAKSLGAEIYATAGSDEKRAYLRGLGIEHVFNSRSLGFADEVLAATGGRGVDVVLNALPSQYIAKGLEVLAPFGRFLEIGKRDVYDDTPVGMHALRRNISFNVIDLAAMGVQRPDLLSEVLGDVLARFEDGTYRPLPLTLFPIERTAEGFDLMAKGRHMGKVVIGIGAGKTRARASAGRAMVMHADRSYLVTGGTNGFGVEIAGWLARRGAGHIILASRSGRLAENTRLPDELMSLGARCEMVALDIADEAAVRDFIAARARSDAPLAGIVHGAAVFRDGLLGQLTQDSVEAVIRPKIGGAWALQRALTQSGVELDFFLSLSSVAQVLGSLGQANYVAANSFLEGFAAYRSTNGMAAQVVNLGALAEAGFVADNSAMGSYLDSLGILPMATSGTLDLLDGFAASSATSRCVAAIDWGRVQSATGRASVSPRLAGLMPGNRQGDQKLRQLLDGMPVANWTALLEDFLVAEVGRVLDVEPEAVPVNRPLAELGLDSLSSIELKNRIESKLALSLTVGAFLQAPTLEKLASVIASTLEEQSRSGREASADQQGGGQVAAATVRRPIQLWAAKLALAPMTSDGGRASLEQVALRELAAPVDLGVLRERLAQITISAEDLALSFSAGTADLTTGRPPILVVAEEPAAELSRGLALEDGELVRLVAGVDGGQITTLGVRLHLAVAIEANSLLDALEYGDAGLIEQAGVAALTEEAQIGATASSLALLEPWVTAPELPGAVLAGVGCLQGLNHGVPRRLRVLRSETPISEAGAILAFGQAIGAVLGTRDVLIERFSAAFGHSSPVRVSTEPDQGGALAIVEHQLSLVSHCLDTSALEVGLTAELDAEGVRARQFGFSHRSETDIAPPAWNALSLHCIVAADQTHVDLIFDPQAIDDASVEAIAAAVRERLGQASAAAPLLRTGDLPEDGVEAVTPVAFPKGPAPILPGQAVTQTLGHLLDGLADPRATATLRRASMLAQAIQVRPALDLTRLRRAIGQLVDRHDFLRSHFAFHGGQWRVLTDNDIAPLSVHDLAEAGDAEFNRRVRDLAERPYDPGRPPLIEIHLLRRGSKGDVVMVRLFEGIADGWSLGLVLDELLKAYLGLDLGTRPPRLPQILHLASAGPEGRHVVRDGIDRLKLGPNRIWTIHLKGADTVRALAKSLGTTENGLLSAGFALSLAEAGFSVAELGTYDPARSDPQLHGAVAFLSRLVALDVPRGANVQAVAHGMDAQFMDLGSRQEILGAVPEFIYAPVLPRHMLEQSLFGPAMRQITRGQVSMMSMQVETLDLVPTGLQEGRLQLRPLPIDGRLDLRLHYDIATFSDADVAALALRLLSLVGVPRSKVEGESLSDIIVAPEDLVATAPLAAK